MSGGGEKGPVCLQVRACVGTGRPVLLQAFVAGDEDVGVG
jgi:hypothetical protein